MGRYVSVEVDIPLSDIDTDDLVEELKHRKKKGEQINVSISDVDYCFKNDKELIEHFKNCLQIRTAMSFNEYKERIIEEIKNLI